MIDAITRHQIFIQRLAGGIYKDILPTLKKLQQDISTRILTATPYETSRLTILLNDINTIIQQSISGNITPSLFMDFATYEQEWTLSLLDKETSPTVIIGAGLNTEALSKVVTSAKIEMTGKKPMTIDQAIKIFSTRYYSDIKSELELGLASGNTLDEIAKNVQSLSNTRTRQQAESLVRTITNHVGNTSRDSIFSQYDYLFTSERFVATLDSRTSFICMSLDGNVYPIGKAPRPPLHYNSVAKGEKVLTIFGEKNIEDIKVGDYVLTHKGRYRKVLNTMNKPCDNGIIRVIYDNVGNTIRVTDEHPLLAYGSGWQRADRIKIGDKLCYNGYYMNNSINRGIQSYILNTKNYPPLFDQSIIPYSIGLKPINMPSTVTFYNYFGRWYSKITNSIIDNKLMDKIKTVFVQNIKKLVFRRENLFSLSFSHRFKHFNFSKSIMNGIIGFHSNRMESMRFRSFFSQPIRPMISTNINAFLNPLYRLYLGYFRPSNGLNLVFLTPFTHRPISKTKFSFYFAKRFFHFMIMFFDKMFRKFNIFKVKHFYSYNVNNIIIVAYNDLVYNIEVEEDNSYLVNGVAVHNCRSIIVKQLDPKYSLNIDKKRASADGPVSAKLTYSGWLRGQPKSVQNEILGVSRAKLFRSGELTLSNFVDSRGKTYTLDELKRADLI